MIHIGKLFEGIKDLNSSSDSKGPRGKAIEIDAIISGDGEDIPIQPVEVDSKIEMWMNRLLTAMKVAIGKSFQRYLSDGTGNPRSKFERGKILPQIRDAPGQILIGMAQYNWTADVQLALATAETGNKAVLKQTKKNYKKKVDIYVDIIDKENLDDMVRERLTALIIMDVHNMEIISMLLDRGIANPNAFEW